MKKFVFAAALLAATSQSHAGVFDKENQFLRIAGPSMFVVPAALVVSQTMPQVKKDHPLLCALGEAAVGSGLTFLAEQSAVQRDDAGIERVVGGIFGFATALTLTFSF